MRNPPGEQKESERAGCCHREKSVHHFVPRDKLQAALTLSLGDEGGTCTADANEDALEASWRDNV
jgi:hypothetical protein